jgi:hypothetical protein
MSGHIYAILRVDYIIYFIWGLINGAVSSSDYIAWENRMVNNEWILTDMERHSRDLI